MIDYLLRYADRLDADIRTGRRVTDVRADGDNFALSFQDGSRLGARAAIAATGYRPDLDHLAPLGALDGQGNPHHRDGYSTALPRLAYVGLEWQRSLSSASIRGVGRDARRAARRLASHLAH
ncbi:hypothetical protein [Streptomyces sclerotialus]|uniref:hypothetical protein n=1 Tax=Streptomyces sclerotialus TaxID=1957 RepID=UPI0004C48B40